MPDSRLITRPDLKYACCAGLPFCLWVRIVPLLGAAGLVGYSCCCCNLIACAHFVWEMVRYNAGFDCDVARAQRVSVQQSLRTVVKCIRGGMKCVGKFILHADPCEFSCLPQPPLSLPPFPTRSASAPSLRELGSSAAQTPSQGTGKLCAASYLRKFRLHASSPLLSAFFGSKTSGSKQCEVAEVRSMAV